MKTYTATEAKNKFGQLLDDAQRGPVRIEKHGRRPMVVMTEEAYEFHLLMQQPEIREAVNEGFAQADRGETVDGRTALHRLKAEIANHTVSATDD